MPDWLVSAARFTLFVTPDAEIPPTLWRDVVGVDPEHSSIQRLISTSVDMGPFGEGVLRLQVQPMRVDWSYDAVEAGARGASPPNFGRFPNAIDVFLQLITRWAEAPSFPSVTRIALGVTLIWPTPNRETGYAELAAFIDGVPTFPDATEFVYQINRPRGSPVITDLVINRLSRWSVGGYVAFTVNLGLPQQLTPVPQTHVRLELDINTGAEHVGAIPREQVQSVIGDLLNGAIEISERGNRLQ
jgi:hypothetical protein